MGIDLLNDGIDRYHGIGFDTKQAPVFTGLCTPSGRAALPKLFELWDYTADDNVARADAFIEDAHAKIYLDLHDRFSRSLR